jgi:hypothetical protein
MGEVDAILARFPGPVTLYPSKPKLFAIFALMLGLTFLFAHVAVVRTNFVWYQTGMMALAALIVGFGAVRWAVLLLPGAMSLTLDADGFECCFLFRRERFRWQDASGFRPQKGNEMRKGTKVGAIAFDVRPTIAGIQRGTAAKARSSLPDNFRLPKDDLVLLMEQWRERALAANR